MRTHGRPTVWVAANSVGPLLYADASDRLSLTAAIFLGERTLLSGMRLLVTILTLALF